MIIIECFSIGFGMAIQWETRQNAVDESNTVEIGKCCKLQFGAGMAAASFETSKSLTNG
jgi:hypothetical protein